KASGEAKETLEVVDVAQLLARSVTAAPSPGAAPAPPPGGDPVSGTAELPGRSGGAPFRSGPFRSGPFRSVRGQRVRGQRVEARIAVTPAHAGLHLGDLPAAPVRLAVVDREQVVAQAPRHGGQPAERHGEAVPDPG